MYKILGGDGKEYGPVSADAVRQWVAEGRANAQTQVLQEGGANWVPLGQVAEFSLMFTAQVTAGRPAGSLPQISGGTNPMAITGMIMGISSLTIGLFCLFCLSPLMAILGIVFSVIGLSQIKANPTQSGRGMAIAGLITSIIGLVVGIAFIAFFGLMGALSEATK